MSIYQRLGEALSLEEIEEIWAEIQDRFGPPPLPAQWLYNFSRVRVFAGLNGYTAMKMEKSSLAVEQQKNGQTVVRRVVFAPPKTPDEFEKRILEVLGG